MRSRAIQHGILGLVILATVLWMDLVPPDLLWRVGLYGLAWAAASTLLVASAGACIALARMRHAGRH